MIYHTITPNDWQEARKKGYYEPQSVADVGYIHCSVLDQIIAVSNLVFTRRSDLIILEIDETKVKADVILEDLKGHGRFPHIYGRLNLDAVNEIYPLLLDENPESKVKFKLPQALIPPAIMLHKKGEL